MSKFRLWVAVTLLAALVAACGGSPTPALPTPSDATVVPTVTPGADGTAEVEGEPTAQMTAEETPPPIAGSFEGTPEVAAEAVFMIQVSGNTELTIDSAENATITDEVVGSTAQGEASPVLNTPNVTMRYLRFMQGDQSYTFELSFSEETVAPGTFEIGVDNVNSTIGNNVNEDAGGDTQDSVDTESTAEATSASSASGSSTASPTQANSSGGQGADTAQDTNNPDSNAPGLGVTERDETFAPIIAARLIPADIEATEYNLLLGGTLTIDALADGSVSGSFEFQLAPAADPEQTITVSGTFTDIPFTATDGESLTPAP